MLQKIYHSFSTRIIVVIGLILLFILSAYFIFFTQRLTSALRDGLVQQGENLVRNLGFASELGVLAGDPTFVDASITGVLEQTDVVFVGVYNKKDDIIAAKEKIPGLSHIVQADMARGTDVGDLIYDGETYLSFSAPITIRTSGIPETGDPIGYSRLVLSMDRITTEQHRAILLYGIVSVVIFFGAGITAAYFTRRMTRSIDKLVVGVNQISAGEFEKRVVVETPDEFGHLADAFNHMAQNLLEARTRDRDISRLKSEFLSIAAHQLRTPLTGLKWMFSSLLKKDMGALGHEQEEALRRGFQTNERMIGLVNDLLNVVQIEEGKFGYEFTHVSPIKLILQAVEDVRPLAETRRITVAMHRPSHPLPATRLDLKKLPLALTNILENAVSYTPPGGAVDVYADARGGAIFIRVQDTGVGIPPEQSSFLFNKFFRAANAITMKPNGSGLGLFITRNVVEKHGGKIRIESEQGRGTTVFITIPIV
jgi:signal transduction histidine kinase